MQRSRLSEASSEAFQTFPSSSTGFPSCVHNDTILFIFFNRVLGLTPHLWLTVLRLLLTASQ